MWARCVPKVVEYLNNNEENKASKYGGLEVCFSDLEFRQNVHRKGGFTSRAG